ncbi:MAG TPA: response regulator [Vicinamibacteria bacterium]
MSKTVLVVDDSKTTQMLVKTTLNRIPMLSMLEAGNGREALAVLQQQSVDLLVTDIQMPEMDGIELVRAVRGQEDLRRLPILIITAKGEEAARGEGLRLGANAYILKPISGKELIDTASRLLKEPAQTA